MKKQSLVVMSAFLLSLSVKPMIWEDQMVWDCQEGEHLRCLDGKGYLDKEKTKEFDEFIQELADCLRNVHFPLRKDRSEAPADSAKKPEPVYDEAKPDQVGVDPKVQDTIAGSNVQGVMVLDHSEKEDCDDSVGQYSESKDSLAVVLEEEFMIAFTRIASYNRHLLGTALGDYVAYVCDVLPYDEYKRLEAAGEYLHYQIDDLPHLKLRGCYELAWQTEKRKNIFLAFLTSLKSLLTSAHEAAPYRNVIAEQNMLFQTYHDVVKNLID